MTRTFRKAIFVATTLLMLSLLIYGQTAAKWEEPTTPHAANSMWVEPEISQLNLNEVTPGYKFNVTVWVNISEPCYSWQATLKYNTTCLNVSTTDSGPRVGYTAGTTSNFFAGHSTVPVSAKVNETAGYILIGESLVGSDEKEPGYGSLFWAEFNLTQLPANDTYLRFELVDIPEESAYTFVLRPYPDMTEIEINTYPQSIHVIPEFPSALLFMALSALLVTAIAVIASKRMISKPKFEPQNP